MGPKLPAKASDYRFYTDRTAMINKQRNQMRKPPHATLGVNDLNVNVYNPTTGETYNLYDEVKDFYVSDKNGVQVFGMNNQYQYSLFMQCQAKADADNNGVFSDEEFSNFKNLLKDKVAGMPYCAPIEGLSTEQEVAKTTTGNLDQEI